MRRIQRERPELVAQVLEEVRARGPVAASEVLEHERPERTGPWWDWSDVKRAFEWLFWSGQITSARRRGFERLYDLPERVLPAEVIATPTPSVEDAQRELVRVAARALGVGDRARPARLLPAAGAPRRASADRRARRGGRAVAGRGRGLARAGLPRPRRAAAAAGRRARAASARSTRSIWERPRVERLFGFRYRIEIYVPAPKRVHGYYVLPFLLGDRLVARVDLKADRQAGVLRVQAAHAEPDAPPETAAELRAELEAMAGWLGLERIDVVAPRRPGAGAGSPPRRLTRRMSPRAPVWQHQVTLVPSGQGIGVGTLCRVQPALP